MSETVKTWVSGVTKNLDGRRVRVVMTAANEDRDGDIIETKGIDVAQYEANPVVLFNHNPNEPIATAREITRGDSSMEATIEFPEPGVNPKSDQVHGLIKAGTLNAVSVRLRPTKAIPMDDRAPWLGKRYMESELLELSVVSIPANPAAQIIERSTGDLSGLDQIDLAIRNLAAIRASKDVAPEADEPTSEPVELVEAVPEDVVEEPAAEPVKSEGPDIAAARRAEIRKAEIRLREIAVG